MLDLHQCQNIPRNQFYPAYHVRGSRDSIEEKEFDFWGPQHKHIRSENFDGHVDGGELELRSQARTEQDYFGSYSTPSRDTNTLRTRNIKDESSPLLPHNHQYSNPSPTSPRQAILQSRRELTEMIQDMPDSWSELSLKDIVDEQQGIPGVKEGGIDAAEETSFDFHTEPQIRMRKSEKKKSYNPKHQISRTSSSMESESFLIKMFFPTFLGSKKKAKPAENCSKVSPRPSLSGPENRKDWDMIGFFLGVNKHSRRSCSTGSTSSSNSSTTRFSDSSDLRGCWFFRSKKSKSKRQRGCLL